MYYRQQLGKMIKKARKEKKLEIREVANFLNVPRICVHDIELGNRLPSMEELKKISEILDIHLDIDSHKKELDKEPISISKRRKYLLDFAPDVTETEKRAAYERIDKLNN